MNQNPSFSTVISAGLSQSKSNSRPPTNDDFPALSSARPSKSSSHHQQDSSSSSAAGAPGSGSREEILMSNLLGNSGSGSSGGTQQKGTASAIRNTAAGRASASSNGPSSIGSGIMNSGNMEFSTLNPQSSSGVTSRSGTGDAPSSYKQHSSSGGVGLSSEDPLLLKDKFGMLGMLDVVRMTNQDLSMLALGTDLTTLGLNLNGGDNIYSTFMTPFSDTPTAAATGPAPASNGEPVYTLHSAYTSLRSPAPLAKMKDFSDETMFYIFYAMPRDVLQEAAAQELYSRSWRFHKEFKLWLTKDPANPEPIQKGIDFERGVYIFFDPATWTRVKLERVLYFDHLEERISHGSNGSTSKLLNGVVSDMQKVDIGAK